MSNFPQKRKKKVSISAREAEIIDYEEHPFSSSPVLRVPVESMTSTAAESDDSLATLPSVKELASKFTPVKSPEPKPRKSIVKKRNEFAVKKQHFPAEVKKICTFYVSFVHFILAFKIFFLLLFNNRLTN